MKHMLRKEQKPTHAQALVTLRTGRPVSEVLGDMQRQGRSQGAMAEALGVSRNTIGMWLREFGLIGADRAPVEEIASESVA